MNVSRKRLFPGLSLHLRPNLKSPRLRAVQNFFATHPNLEGEAHNLGPHVLRLPP
jgi:hypothetical protein